MNKKSIQIQVSIFAILATMFLTSVAATEETNEADKVRKERVQESPVRNIERNPKLHHSFEKANKNFRTIDGSSNNLTNIHYNAAKTPLIRRTSSDYSDSMQQMAGQNRVGAREISNAISAQVDDMINQRGISDYLWQWGQFLDHDISLTDGISPAELTSIQIPNGDVYFDPDATGNQTLPFNRSYYDPLSGTDLSNPRQQINEITGWIDASNVYGSNKTRAHALRTNDGTGHLKTSKGQLLPFNIDGLPNAGGSSSQFFLAGDVRANEQVGLTAMHTLFVREHNRLARLIRRKLPSLSGDEIYNYARRLVGAQMQIITYEEFIPLLLGEGALTPYTGYDSNVDPRIMNEFSTAAFRFGHSLLSATILRVSKSGRRIKAGHLALRDAFFAPHEIIDHGIEPILRGLSKQASQILDVHVVDDVRNFLFGQPGQGGFDLAALNIQRGRDHGLLSYNDTRELMGFTRAETFAAITSDFELQARLASVYASTDEIDLWIGGLAEDRIPQALVGELFYYILKEQFEALRDGDRFWHQNRWKAKQSKNLRINRLLEKIERQEVRDIRLSRIIQRNTRIRGEMHADAFLTNGVTH